MRILMVNLTDWSGMSGGAQHQLGLFEAFRAAGHELRVLTVGRGECLSRGGVSEKSVGRRVRARAKSTRPSPLFSGANR